MDDRLYVGRDAASGSGYDELHIFDVSDPANPVQLGQTNFNHDVNALFAGDELLFLATDYANEELRIFDVTDPEDPLYYSGMNFSQVATDIAFEDNTVYVSVRSNDAHRIITSEQ
jgi:hypothetical protein